MRPHLHHRVRRALDPFLRNRARKTVPTVPAHLRRERNLVAADDAETFLCRAERILRDQRDDGLAFLLQLAGDAAGFRIQLQAARQVGCRKCHGPVARRGDHVKERRTGPHAKDVRSVDARRGRRGRREDVRRDRYGGRVRSGRGIRVGSAKMDGAAKAKGQRQA